MKSIEELGITAFPWTVHPSDNEHYARIEANCEGSYWGETICVANTCYVDADAQLMAASPELYESLEEAQREVCFNCHGSEVPRGDEYCDQCIVAGWIEALKKAGGDE